MRIDGTCHCSNIIFALDWQPSPSEIPARACGCSFCTKHGGVWTSTPTGVLKITVQDAALVSRYAFGTRTAEFHVCSKCGVVPVVTSEIEERLYAVVNVNTFDGVDAALLRRSPANFDGEGTDSRLARRARNWIGNVHFVSASEETR
jgi:Uncharacterized conserved protein